MSVPRAVRTTSLGALALFAATACGTDDGSETKAASAEAMSCQQFDWYSGKVLAGTQEPSDPDVESIVPGRSLGPIEMPVLRSVSMTQEGRTDNIVFDVVGNGYVGWSARFVQSPRTYMSDEPVEVSGVCMLQIDLTGVDRASTASERVTPSNESTVVEALTYPGEDGVTQAFVGTRVASPVVEFEASADGDTASVTVSISPSAS